MAVCLFRPSSVIQFDDAENPTIIEDFIHALGAEAIVYPFRNECCGGYISFPYCWDAICN